MSQIKVDLLIGANTSAAQNNIKQLSASLAQVAKTTPIGIDNGPLHTAVQTAQQLQTHLQNAVNVDTGKLNLHQFNTSLKQAGMDLNTLTQRLLVTGQTGQQAFVQMANAIAYAQTPMLNFGTKLSGLFTTLTNTLKWSIASKAIQGVTSAISGAIKHAEDLNTALNKIRIVTGYSTEYMAAFADNARKAAQELGTTSTEYAKAALIFYQQGLKGDAVLDRANTVIKMANVTGQTAEVVSDQMTAIWNNFYDGSKSLEYYADAITALGASTASSTDEIAQGLEKFAAIADTVGLSYEYATAALATVTAQTRQSADVVGTAFKTIFARMEGLRLGDTLEDGTTLNQYTEAMAKAGINIKDSNDQLKDMDTILQEMGKKWEGLNKDQQIALAQQVGGLRQYNQLIALMDNWDKVELNVEIAENAEGTLQEQADIWGESWEAASKRVKESQNVLYENFLDDETIVNLTNMFADLIKTIDTLVDSFGGIGPLALTLMGIFSKSFFPMLINGFHTITGNLSVMFGFAQKNVIATQNSAMALIQEVAARNDVSLAMKKQLEVSSFLINAKKELALQTHGLSKAQKQAANAQMDALQAEAEAIQLGYQEIDMLEKKAKAYGATVTANIDQSNKERMGIVNQATTFANSRQGNFTSEERQDIAKTATMKTMSEGKAVGLKNAAIQERDAVVEKFNQNPALLEKQRLDAKMASGSILTAGETKHYDKIQAELEATKKIQDERLAQLDKEIQKWETVAKIIRQGKTDAKDSEAMFKAPALKENGKTQRTARTDKKNDIYTTAGGKKAGLSEEEMGAADSARVMQAQAMGRFNQAGVQANIVTNNQEGTKSLNVAASQESLAMASQMQGEYAAKSEHLKTVLGELTITEASLTQSEEELNAARTKGGKTTLKSRQLEKQFDKEIAKVRTSLTTLGKSFTMTKKQQDVFNKGLDLLGKKTPGSVKKGMKQITNVLTELRQGTKMTENEMADLGDKILQELVAAGGGEDDLRRLMDTMKQMGFDAEKLDASLKKLQKPQINVSPFQKLGQSVATNVGQLSMLVSSLNMLKSAFSEGIFSAQGMMSALMAISMLLPSLTVLQNMFNLSKTKEAVVTAAATAAKWLDAKASEAQARAEEKEAKTSLAASLLKIGGNIANWISKGPVGWAIAAISAAAIAAIIGISLFSGGKSAEEEKSEEGDKQFEEAKAVMESANAWKEKNEEVDKLVQTYDELSKKTNRTIEEEKQLKQAQEDIINQMPELLQKYQELGDELGQDWSTEIDFIAGALAIGDVDTAIQAEAELEEKANAATAKKAAEGMTGKAYSVAAKMSEVQGSIDSDGKYSVSVGDANSDDVEKLVNDSYLSKANGEDSITLDTSDGQQFVKDYEELKRIAKEAEDKGYTGDDAYQEIKELLDASAEDYEALKGLRDEALSFTLSDLQTEEGIDPSTIDSYDEYLAKKQELIDAAVESGKATKEEAAAFFEGQSALSDYAGMEKKFAYVKEQYGKQTAQELQDWASSELSDEEQKFFMQVDFSKFSSKEAIQGQIDMLQKEADANAIEIKLTAAENALDMLKKDMSMDDWTKLQTDSGITWGESGIVKFSEFVDASYEEQSTYLRQLEAESYDSFMSTTEEKLAILTESLATLEALSPEERGENYDAEIEAIEEQIEETEILRNMRKQDKAAKEREKDEAKKDAIKNIERYHEEIKALESLERQLNRISQAKDRAFGKGKLALMDVEMAKIKEQIAAEEELIATKQTDLKTDRKVINDFGFSTDNLGNISNFDEVKKRNIEHWYSTLSKEEADEKVSEMDEAIEQYEETLSSLEESQDSVIEKQNQLADLALEKIEFKVQMQVDMSEDEMARIDFLMQTLENDAFSAAEKISLMGDKADATLSNIEATEQGIADIMADIAANGGVMTETQAEALRGYRDELINYNAELLEIRNTVQEELTNAYDAWNSKLDESIGYLDHLGSMVDSYQNIIDIAGKDNLGISDATMANMRTTKQANANDRAAAARDKLDANEAQLARAQQALAEATTEDDKKYWEEQVKYAQEQVMSAESEFMDAWSNALQVAADNFAANVQSIADAFSESVSGIYKNLEEMSEAFDRQKEVSERYLEDYEKSYEISKLNRKIQQDLAKTDSAASSKELRDLQEELLALGEEGVDVSERDIEYMQKKYDLLLAEQALKDAQNAKSVVRLQQDSEGNYGYVYTADQQQTDQAQQNYEDKLFALQSYNEQVLLESQEQILAVNQEFQDAMLAIQENANLSNEEKKVKMEELTVYYTEQLGYWEEEASKFLEYNTTCAEEFTVGYGDQIANIDDQNSFATDSWDDMSLSFNDTLLGQMYPDMTSFEEHYAECTESMIDAGADFIDAVEQYEQDNREATEAAGEDYDNFNEKVAEDLSNIRDESSQTATAIDGMKNEMNDDLTEATNKVTSFQQTYSNQMSQIRSATNTTITNINDLIKKYNELASAAKQDFTPDLGSTGGGSSGNNSGLSGSDEKSKSKKTTYAYHVADDPSAGAKASGYVKLEDADGKFKGYAKNSTLTYNDNKDKANASGAVYHTLIYKNNGSEVHSGIAYSGEWTENKTSGGDRNVSLIGVSHGDYDTGLFVDDDKSLRNKMEERAGYIVKNDKRYYAFKFKNSTLQHDSGEYYFAERGSFIEDVGSQGIQINNGSKFWSFGSYDTGGYTGEWGPEGRLAMLHQKEIVLNAHDTENLLSIISIVRDMNDRIELNARAMQYGLTAAYSASNIKSQNDTLQQEVHITAEFPNATNHSEIEEAFRNLSGQAAQYVHQQQKLTNQ